MEAGTADQEDTVSRRFTLGVCCGRSHILSPFIDPTPGGIAQNFFKQSDSVRFRKADHPLDALHCLDTGGREALRGGDER